MGVYENVVQRCIGLTVFEPVRLDNFLGLIDDVGHVNLFFGEVLRWSAR